MAIIWTILCLQLMLILGLSYLISRLSAILESINECRTFAARESLSMRAKIDSLKDNVKIDPQALDEIRKLSDCYQGLHVETSQLWKEIKKKPKKASPPKTSDSYQ